VGQAIDVYRLSRPASQTQSPIAGPYFPGNFPASAAFAASAGFESWERRDATLQVSDIQVDTPKRGSTHFMRIRYAAKIATGKSQSGI